jgi:hypothetical protein
MTLRKKLLTGAVVGAMTVATAVPAMALENEFHGLFRVRGFISNFDDGGAGALLVADPTKGGLVNGYQPGTKNFIEQRARLMYIAKANDDLKLVTHFEIDSRWGDNSYNSNNTTRNNGGGIGADQVNLETKNVYLDFNIPSTKVNVKAGIQGFNDNYKGIIFNNDAAGVVVTSKYNKATAQIAYFRFDDATTSPAATPGFGPAGYANLGGTSAGGAAGSAAVVNTTVGSRTRDFVNVGGKYNVTDSIKVGADYYLLYSDVFRNVADRTDIHMLGVNAEAKVGPATIDGFFLYQVGQLGNTTAALGNAQTVGAFAGNLGGKVKTGPGTARVNFLYISGDADPTHGKDRNDFQTILERSATTAGHAFYPGEMLLLLRSKYATAGTDRAVVFDLNNNQQGFIGGFLGYDLNIDKFFVYSNAGFAAVAKTNGNSAKNQSLSTPKTESQYLGTELNTEIGYKLYDNLAASFQAAYLILGDFYKRSSKTGAGNPADPENPYSTRVMLTYTF